jgi:hypothetical protein
MQVGRYLLIKDELGSLQKTFVILFTLSSVNICNSESNVGT